MPIIRPAPPAQAERAVVAALDRAPEAPAGRSALGGSRPDELAPSDPHPVHVLGLDDLRAGTGLAAASRTGWRYLLRAGERPRASAETVTTPDGDGQRFALFNSGPFVGSTAEALATAEDLPEVSDRDYEPRLLLMPAVKLIALWLHAEGDDLLVPLAPAPPGVEADRRYPAAELLETMRAVAATIPDTADGDARGG